jgi:Na+/H+-translocating membrane pyrophosphatase
MLPYWFSAMTVKAVGLAALRMVDEARSCLPTSNSFFHAIRA